MLIKARLWKTPSTGRLRSTISGRVFFIRGRKMRSVALAMKQSSMGGRPTMVAGETGWRRLGMAVRGETGEEDFVDVFRQGRGGGVGHRGVGADGHRRGQDLAPGLGHPVVLGPALMGVPVHAGGVG